MLVQENHNTMIMKEARERRQKMTEVCVNMSSLTMISPSSSPFSSCSLPRPTLMRLSRCPLLTSRLRHFAMIRHCVLSYCHYSPQLRHSLSIQCDWLFRDLSVVLAKSYICGYVGNCFSTRMDGYCLLHSTALSRCVVSYRSRH